MPIKILVADDHELTRNGIVYGLSKYKDIKIVGAVDNVDKAISLFDSLEIDVVLTDYQLQNSCIMEMIQIIKKVKPTVKIIIFTSDTAKESVFSAFDAGISAYCLKNIKFSRLHKIIHLIIDGGTWLDPQISEIAANVFTFILRHPNILANGQKQFVDQEINCLTAREKEILQLLTKGLSNKEISDALLISVYTVKNHVSSLISKLSVNCRTQAAIVALKEGVI